MSTWSVIQYEVNFQADANWVLLENNTVARQIVNADPSILFSDFELADTRIEGTWRLDTSDDDDLMGFVFGYQDSKHFYLFDWKQNNQNNITGHFVSAERGMSVKIISADSKLTIHDFWLTAGSANPVNTIYHNTISWKNFTDYNFTLDFHPGEFTITVTEGDTVLDTIILTDHTYTSGGFGFYNSSQGEVLYTGFTQTTLPEATYFSDSGEIHWGPATDQNGNHTVIIRSQRRSWRHQHTNFRRLCPWGSQKPSTNNHQ